jgi:hypothetical protein
VPPTPMPVLVIYTIADHTTSVANSRLPRPPPPPRWNARAAAFWRGVGAARLALSVACARITAPGGGAGLPRCALLAPPAHRVRHLRACWRMNPRDSSCCCLFTLLSYPAAPRHLCASPQPMTVAPALPLRRAAHWAGAGASSPACPPARLLRGGTDQSAGPQLKAGALRCTYMPPMPSIRFASAACVTGADRGVRCAHAALH